MTGGAGSTVTLHALEAMAVLCAAARAAGHDPGVAAWSREDGEAEIGALTAHCTRCSAYWRVLRLGTTWSVLADWCTEPCVAEVRP